MPLNQTPGAATGSAAGDAARIDALMRSEPTPIIQTAIAAFRRDLPALLATHRGDWVAYHGENRIGVGDTKTQLYRLCRQRGWSHDEVLVCGIEEGVFNPDDEVIASENL